MKLLYNITINVTIISICIYLISVFVDIKPSTWIQVVCCLGFFGGMWFSHIIADKEDDKIKSLETRINELEKNKEI